MNEIFANTSNDPERQPTTGSLDTLEVYLSDRERH